MKNLSRTFLTGLATVLPVAATIYLVVWLVATSEAFLGATLRFLLPDALYAPGLGVAVGIVLLFLVGLLMRTWVARKLFSWGETFLYRVPLVKTIYGALRDFFEFFSQEKPKESQEVVVVRVGDTDMKLIGFVTRSDLTGYPAGIGEAGTVAVYMPMSYQIGGYTVLVPREAVRPVGLSFQEGMRFVLTAGVSARPPKGPAGSEGRRGG